MTTPTRPPIPAEYAQEGISVRVCFCGAWVAVIDGWEFCEDECPLTAIYRSLVYVREVAA